MLRPGSARRTLMKTFPVCCRCSGLSLVALALFLFALVLSGCSLLSSSSSSTPKAEVKALKSKSVKVGSTTLATLQNDSMRFADDYATTVAQAADDFSASTTNDALRIAALRWKLEQAGAAYVNASGRNPILNALDMVVLATLSRMVVEDPEVAARLADAAPALAATHRRLETNAWDLVAAVLRPEQKTELGSLMEEWRRKNPHQRYVGGVRFREFAIDVGQGVETASRKPTSVFNLLFIDPMAGLDPTARAIAETRQSAERLTYYAQRAPVLLSWQAELLSYQLADQPTARRLLNNVQSLSDSTAAFARTADKIPELVDQQRHAAIQQLFDGIAVERTNLLAALDSQNDKTRSLLVETRQTLNAGTQMASSLDSAIQSMNSFVRYVYRPTDSNAAPVNVSTNNRPFDILDYGQAASQLGAAALDLNTLLGSINQSTPQVAQLSKQAQSDARRFLDRAFWQAVLLIVILLVGSVIAALAYKILAARIARPLPAAADRLQNQPKTDPTAMRL
jgi:hypothetical protein